MAIVNARPRDYRRAIVVRKIRGRSGPIDDDLSLPDDESRVINGVGPWK